MIIFIIQSLIARYFYLPTNPSYSMTTNYISEMGAGPLETKMTITISYTIIGILILLFYFYVARDLKIKNLEPGKILLIQVLGIIIGVSFICLGLFHLDPAEPVAYELHKISTVSFFGLQAILLFIYGYIEYTNSELSKKFAVLSFIVGLFFIIFATGFAIVEYSALPRQTFIFVIEYIGAYSMLFWLFLKGIYFIKNP